MTSSQEQLVVFKPGWLSALALLVGISLLTLVFVEGVGVVVSDSLGPETGSHTVVTHDFFDRSARFLRGVGRHDDDDDDDGRVAGGLMNLASFLLYAIITALQVAIVFFFSLAYKQGVVDKIPQMIPQAGGNAAFKHGLFAGCCWNDCQTCMHVCCCPQARVAHTLKIAGLAEYWIIVLLYMFLNLGGGCCCAVSAFSFYFRTQLKKKAGVKPDTMADLCVACFCTACGTCQEAMEIDDATGAHVSCCCLVQVDTVEASVVPMQVVGQPVEA